MYKTLQQSTFLYFLNYECVDFAYQKFLGQATLETTKRLDQAELEILAKQHVSAMKTHPFKHVRVTEIKCL